MYRHHCSSKTLGVYDVVGSYFVDIFYNNHYLLARDLVQRGAANNITDAYRINIINYINGISSNDNLFKKVVMNLHEYYQRYIGFNSILLTEFQNKILSQFIPAEHYQYFTDLRRDKTLKDILIHTITSLGEIVVERPMLGRIIDDHMNRENVTLLQDRIVDIFIMQREQYYTMFAMEIVNKDKDKNKIMDETLVKKLKEAYIAERRKVYDLTDDKDRAINIIQQLAKKIQDLSNENKILSVKLANNNNYKINNAAHFISETKKSDQPSEPIIDVPTTEPTSALPPVRVPSAEVGAPISIDDDPWF